MSAFTPASRRCKRRACVNYEASASPALNSPPAMLESDSFRRSRPAAASAPSQVNTCLEAVPASLLRILRTVRSG